MQVTSICLLHSSCFYVETSQLLCLHYYLCNCEVRRNDVISGDTKLIITPFPEEYMLIVLYIVHNFTTNQTKIKMKTCKCWDVWRGWNQCKLNILNDEFLYISLSNCTRHVPYLEAIIANTICGLLVDYCKMKKKNENAQNHCMH